MYDLSMKDKPRSAFDKLRERMRAKKRSNEEDSSSAIVAGGYGELVRMRGRLPSDGGGEEDYEDDEGGEVRRSKMRSFFLRGRLRKSSDTRSSTSLGSESSESSSRGGSLSPTAGISVVVSDLSNSPSNSSNLTADNSPDHTMAPSPQVSPVRHVYVNEMCDFSLPVPHSVTSENDTPILLPSVCINGNPVETSPLTHHPPSLILQQPQPESTKPVNQSGEPRAIKLPAKPKNTQSTEPNSKHSAETKLSKSESKPRPEPQLAALGLIQKGSSLTLSLQNLSRRGEEKQSSGPMDGRRWSFDKPGEEEKAAIVAALENAGRVTDESAMETVIPVGETDKKRRGLFSHGRGVSAGKGPITSKEEAEHAQQPVEVKHKGWFSSKDSHSKPRPLVSLKSDSTGTTNCPIVPFNLSDPSQNMANQLANSFTLPPPLFEANQFLPLVQQNPLPQETSDVPSSPVIPSLSSSAHYQSESGGNPTPDLLKIENVKGPSGESQIDNSVDYFSTDLAQMDEDDFGKFANDRLKSLEEENEAENLVTTPTVLMKPNNPEPLGVLSGLTVLDTNDLTHLGKTALAGTTGEASMEPAAKPQVSGSDGNLNKYDLTNPGVFDFPEFGSSISEISLPDNSSVEFSELNALACPYPALSAASQNEDNADAMISEESPKICLPSQNAKSNIACELSKDVHVSPGTSQRPEALEFAKDMESVKIHEDATACHSDNSSGDTPGKPSNVTSDSLSREQHQSIKPCHSQQSDFISNNMKQSDEGFLESNASIVNFTEPSEVHIPSAPSFSVSAASPLEVKNKEALNVVIDTKLLKDAFVKTGDLCSEIEGSVPRNLNDITSSPGLSKSVSNDMQVNEQKVCEFKNNPCKDGNLVSCIGEGHEMIQSGQKLPVEHLNPTIWDNTGTEGDPFNPNTELSLGSMLFHSLYKSADSEYLTCVSQQDSKCPCLELTQEAKPEHDQSGEDTSQFGLLPKHVTVCNVMPKDDMSAKGIKETDCEKNQDMVEHFKPQEDLPKQESPQGNVSLNSFNTSGEIREHDLPKDVRSKINISQDLIAELEAQLAPLKTETCLVDNCETCPSKHNFQIDSLIAETFWSGTDIKLNSAQLTEPNVCGSNCASSITQTSSITQDLVITDFNLENIFVPKPTETLHTGLSPVTHSESPWTQNGFKPSKNLNTNNEVHITPTFPDSVTLDLFPVNWPPLSQPFPSAFDQPTLASKYNQNLHFPSSMFDLSPLASSTPHVAVDTNDVPQLFPFSQIPPSSEEPWPNPALVPPLQPVSVTSHNPFLQEKSQTTNHQSSPHPVKPLTPPDEKRSEGRSVLEKLKSTIHSGRSHQDSDKKLLVEGGGSYYHLNHTELVNLLIQRDTELKQERGEFERRRALLEKREVELKKMKVYIRDLEDYIDTLLVRIMEQTPTLLQVRSKMK